VGERPGTTRERHRRPRRGRRRSGGDREPRDERARGRDRRRRSERRGRLPRTLPRDGGVLARTDALRRRLRADRRTGDGDQRRMGSRAARARHLPRPLAAAVPGLGRRHAAPVTRALEPPVVVKLGSSLVVDPEGAPRPGVFSGAIALGAATAGLTGRRAGRSLAQLQAASALGQSELQRLWQEAFEPFGLPTAQILLTATEITDRRSYVNVRSSLRALFDVPAVPVLNENDAV